MSIDKKILSQVQRNLTCAIAPPKQRQTFSSPAKSRCALYHFVKVKMAVTLYKLAAEQRKPSAVLEPEGSRPAAKLQCGT